MTSSIPPQQLREEIEQTRTDLGGTVEALAAKTDVKARAKQQLTAVKDRTVQVAGTAKERVGRASRTPAARKAVPVTAIAAVVAALAGTAVVVVRRRQAAARRPASWWKRYR